MSTPGGVQYIGGIMSTSGDTMSTSVEYHEYIERCSVYHDTCGEIKSVQSALSDLLTTSATHGHVFPPKYEAWTHFNN